MARKSSRKPLTNPLTKKLESLCGEPDPDDGVDPRDFFKPARNRRNCRKDWQLCRQVTETLNYVLSGECHEEILRSLMIREVVPAPDAHRLLVTVCPFAPDKNFNPILALQRLQQEVGRLRSAVASSISRRKVPELVFRVVIDDSSFPLGMEIPNDQ